MTARPTAAPAHFPYAHRNMAQVMAEEARAAALERSVRQGDLIAREMLRQSA